MKNEVVSVQVVRITPGHNYKKIGIDMKNFDSTLTKHLNEDPTPGSVIRAFRHKLGFTLDDVYNLTGISPSNLSRIENSGKISPQNAEKLALVLGIHPGSILFPPKKNQDKNSRQLQKKAKALYLEKLKKHG